MKREDFRNKSYWLSSRDYKPNPGLSGDVKVDVAIVGGGPVSLTADMAPAIGYVGDKRMVYSLGCMGYGVSLTHLNGVTAADLVLEKKTDLTDVFFVNRRTIPWPPQPLSTIAAKAVMAGLKMQDRFTD